jgi:UDP-glucose 4-epimerase
MKRVEKWLITGGAGYIGSHIVDDFLANGKEIVVFDNLENGQISRLEFLGNKYKKVVPLVKGDIRDSALFTHTLTSYEISGIIHTAALKSVSESFLHEDRYFDVNLRGTENIIECARKNRVNKMIFSSTAAVYGPTFGFEPISEDATTIPQSPYGMSKLAAEERVTKFLQEANHFGSILRFFNVVGCSSLELIDRSEDNLIPITIRRYLKGESAVIFGNDYDTKDGTCIRDFVDVRDVARSHLLIANSTSKLPLVMNLGTGKGTSVRETIEMVAKLFSSKDFAVDIQERRNGDLPSAFANVALIKRELGFTAAHSILQSLESLRNFKI